MRFKNLRLTTDMKNMCYTIPQKALFEHFTTHVLHSFFIQNVLRYFIVFRDLHECTLNMLY